MKLSHLTLFSVAFLSGCSQDPAGVRIAHEAPVVTTPAQPARVEPIFYNGKTYQVSFASAADGSVDLRITGMSASQAKDASALSTSALHHFACKDSQKAVLQSAPAFDGTTWRAAGRCA